MSCEELKELAIMNDKKADTLTLVLLTSEKDDVVALKKMKITQRKKSLKLDLNKKEQCRRRLCGCFSKMQFNPGNVIGVLIVTRREKSEYEGCSKGVMIST